MRERIGVGLLVAAELLKRAVPVGIAIVYIVVILAVAYIGLSLIGETP